MINRIKKIREILELSQREFGEKLGTSRDVISNIEGGRVIPKEPFLNLICHIYGVNPDWLLHGNGEIFERKKDNNKVDDVLNLFRSLRPEFQDCALEQLDNLLKLQNKFVK